MLSLPQVHFVLRHVTDFFFPLECSICHHTAALEHGLCSRCLDNFYDELIAKDKLRCQFCSRVVPEKTICLSCSHLENPPVHIPIHSLFNYEKRIRNLILNYKIKEHFNLKRIFAKVLAESDFFRHAAQEGFIVVPTPSRRSSFGTMSLIAKEIHKFYGIPVAHVLTSRATKSQKTLTRQERLLNLKNKILFHGKPMPKVLLMDDILTTGATIRECVKVLCEHGNKEIHVLLTASVPEQAHSYVDEPSD